MIIEILILILINIVKVIIIIIIPAGQTKQLEVALPPVLGLYFPNNSNNNNNYTNKRPITIIKYIIVIIPTAHDKQAVLPK